MKKVLYIAPAFIVCMFIGTIGLLWSFGSFVPMAWAYLIFSVLGSALLVMNKWWGCIPGMIFGGLIIYERIENSAYMVIDTLPIGVVFLLYYLIMGLICYKTKMKA